MRPDDIKITETENGFAITEELFLVTFHQTRHTVKTRMTEKDVRDFQEMLGAGPAGWAIVLDLDGDLVHVNLRLTEAVDIEPIEGVEV